MQNTRNFLSLVLGVCVVPIALGCASSTGGGLKVIDANTKDPAFAKSKPIFSTSESAVVRVHGYGGRKVTLQLKEAIRGLVGTVTNDIPKATATNTGRDIGFRSEGGRVIPAERENVRWTTTDLMIPLKPLPVGKYKIILTADDGRTETQAFEVKADTR